MFLLLRFFLLKTLVTKTNIFYWIRSSARSSIFKFCSWNSLYKLLVSGKEKNIKARIIVDIEKRKEKKVRRAKYKSYKTENSFG